MVFWEERQQGVGEVQLALIFHKFSDVARGGENALHLAGFVAVNRGV